MRVGLISLNGQARNAIGNHLAEKVGFFLDRGADVRVFLQSADRIHPALAGHVEVVDQAQSNGPAWDFLAGADLVIVDFAQCYDLLHFLPLLAGRKPRLVVEYHGLTPPQYLPGPQRADLQQGLAQRGLVWCADFVLVHSRFMKDELVQSTGFPEARVLQLDFPLDERLHPGSPQSSARTRLGLAGASVLLFVGRLAANKRLPVLIEAVARLEARQPPVHAVVLGDGADVYAEEERRCLELAKRLGVAQRVHFLGSVSNATLADWYRDADALVMPSVHEGFCIPILEAMACGLPVVAARATALPETVGDAGMTFAPDDAGDLAGRILRVLQDETQTAPSGRVAVVSMRYGIDIVGGAETSLRKIAHALRSTGRAVEVFTTCTRGESVWTDDLPAGTTLQDDILVQRFPLDPHEREAHLESVRQILDDDGHVTAAVEATYLRHSIHSTKLLTTLAERIEEFDAIIVGPYLFGLTWDVARLFPAKTLLLGCFHDEALAHLKVWPAVYGQLGGILYHSPEEQELAQTALGVNHPNNAIIGTHLESHASPRAAQRAMHGRRYLVYCGRYSREKELPRLLEYASRYARLQPGHFTFAFMGCGGVSIPRATWARDLGHVDEGVKRSVLAGAAALVQLSRQESLSLVALEAWAEGTPVLVDRRCAVLAAQVRRSGGGHTIEDFDTFAAALNDLWANPAAWEERGRRGQAYVQEQYASANRFAQGILAAVDGMRTPMREHMRRRGLARAAHSQRSSWRERFGKLVEQVLDAEARPHVCACVVEPVHARTEVKAGTQSLLLPVRVHNRGTHAVCAEGPARSLLYCEVGAGSVTTPLPALLLPGKTQTAAALISVPDQPGEYRMRLWLGRDQDGCVPDEVSESVMIVGSAEGGTCNAPFLLGAQEALAEIERQRRLPDDYLDVTEGWFARGKRWLKRKLLGNFKRGYVDVLSRQQTRVNQQVLTALQHLTECCATLDHAVRGLQERLDRLERQQTDSSLRARALYTESERERESINPAP